MSDSEIVTSKIRSYLEELSPQAVATLVRNLEKARSDGSADAHVDLILRASLELLRASERPVGEAERGIVRRNQIQRKFFTPLDVFLINEHLPTKQEGRVQRSILNRVWHWIGRDILPRDVDQVLNYAENNPISDDKVEALVRNLRRRAVDAVGEILHKIDISDKERRRLGMEVGGERGIADLRDINKIFAAENWLMPFVSAMPEALNDERLKTGNGVLRMVEKATTRFPDHTSLVAAALLDRAESPASLCSFAGRLAGSNDPKAISASPFAPFVDVVLSEAERLNVLAHNHRAHNPDPVAFSQALSEYHDLVRGVELDMDLSHAGVWHKRLSDTKRDISEIVTRELRNAHGAVRRSLQVPTISADGEVESDTQAVDEAVRALRVVVMVRNASQTFAVNDIGKRTRQTVEQTLEIVTRALISDLSKTTGKQREAHLAAVDVAIMLSEIYFGGAYAQQLRRSRQSAIADNVPVEVLEAPKLQPKQVANARAQLRRQ